MQLHISTYGTYLHVKDAMFDVRRKGEDGKLISAMVLTRTWGSCTATIITN